MSKQVYGDPVSSTGSYSAEPSSVGSSLSGGTSSYANYGIINGPQKTTTEEKKEMFDFLVSLTEDAQKSSEPQLNSDEVDELVHKVRREIYEEKLAKI